MISYFKNIIYKFILLEINLSKYFKKLSKYDIKLKLQYIRTSIYLF